jgi:hypothetical protein
MSEHRPDELDLIEERLSAARTRGPGGVTSQTLAHLLQDAEFLLREVRERRAAQMDSRKMIDAVKALRERTGLSIAECHAAVRNGTAGTLPDRKNETGDVSPAATIARDSMEPPGVDWSAAWKTYRSVKALRERTGLSLGKCIEAIRNGTGDTLPTRLPIEKRLDEAGEE